ncbi:hypothetical protein TSOC_014400, partial [Tetrabaena socialis]
MALPEAARDAARRLPSAAARLAGVPGSGMPLSAAEAHQVAGMLSVMHAAFMEDGSLADDLISNEAVRPALLRLVAFAVRDSQQGDPAFAAMAENALSASGALLGLEARAAWRARAQLDFGRKLLRMDTLQAVSRSLSQGAADMQAVGQAPEAPAAAAGPAAEAEAAATAAEGAAETGAVVTQAQVQLSTSTVRLIGMCCLLNSLIRTAHVQVVGGAPQPKQLQRQQQVYACELTAALRDSCVLEHCARWVLHAQLAEAAGRVLLEEKDIGLIVHIGSLSHTHIDALSTTLALRDGVVKAPALRETLSGPCVRHLALSLGLAVLCAADGGPSYGLPPALLLHLPIRGSDGANLRATHGRQRLDTSVLKNMLRVLGSSTTASATPPRDWRSMVGLLRRIGLWAVASARAWAEGEGPAAEAGPAPPPQELALDPSDVLSVALPALDQYRRLVGDQQADPEALAEAEAAWWRLGVDVATRCVRWGSPKELGELADLLSLGWRPLPTGHVPSGLLPLPVASALAGGLLPLWERLLRCAGREPDGPEARLLTCMLRKAEDAEGFCDMLACCEPRQGSSLVATWGKVLRTLTVATLLPSLDAGGTRCAGVLHTALAYTQAEFTWRLLDSLHCRLTLASSGGGAAAAAGAEVLAPEALAQLARVASYAVCEWLPALARCAREALNVQQGCALAGRTANPLLTKYAITIARAVVRWLPVLVATVEGAAVTQPAAEAAASGWRQLLLREVGAVPLLGAACPVLLHYLKLGKDASSLESWGPLIFSCCLLAAACPGEVRQAVLAAAAEADASAGSGSRGRRGAMAGGGRRRGTSGRGGEAGPSRASAPLPPGWSPQLLQLMAVELRSGQGDGWEALA